MSKKRLDQAVQELLPNLSRTQIASIIIQGNVTVNDDVVTKPGMQVKLDDKINVNYTQQKFVSRGGFKLEKALEHFQVDVKNLVALDAGISTGGFTDCLLQHGAKKVYGVDVGYGQVHEKIRQDPRVQIIERSNLRELMQLPEKVDLVSLDLSFISVLKVMDAVVNLMKQNAKLIVLIKPQFEAKKEQVGKGGLIKDERLHKEIIENVVHGIKEFGFKCVGVIDSPITGTTGNKEFLAYFERQPIN